MLCAAIAQIISIHGSNNDVTHAHIGHRAGKIHRLAGIRWFGAAMRHITERATTRANSPQYHEGGRAMTKTFVNIRATGIFTNGDKTVIAQFRLQFFNRIAGGDTHANPAWLAQYRRDFKFHRTAGNFIFAQLFDAFLQGINDRQWNGFCVRHCRVL